MNSIRYDRIDTPPKASAMLEALRGLGYSTATALADVIDNSITARATTVQCGSHGLGKAVLSH